MDNSPNTTKYSNRQSENTPQASNENCFRIVLLLYCIISLLTIVMVLLLIILLKKYCKKCNGNMSDFKIEEGNYCTSDSRCIPDPDHPDNNAVNHLNNAQTDTACYNDSSSTSSDSSCVSDGVKQNKSPQGTHFKNASEGKSTSAQNKNKKATQNRDYVNIKEQQSISLTSARKSKCERHQGDDDESQTSSESSSDEIDDGSVDYTTVVFK